MPKMLKLTGSVRQDRGTNTHMSHEDLQYPLELTPKKTCHFHHRRLEWKSRKSKDIWNNRQVWPWSTKWSTAKTNRILSRETLVIANFLPMTQETTLYMEITKLSILKSDWLYSLQLKMEKLYIVSKEKTWSWLWLRSSASYCKIQENWSK